MVRDRLDDRLTRGSQPAAAVETTFELVATYAT
jgi:hypothetical protein